MNLNQYVCINKNVTIYQYPDEQFIAVIIKKVHQNIRRYIKDVKPDAIKILKLIDGATKLGTFIKIARNKYNISEESVLQFVEDSIKVGILELGNLQNHANLKIIGNCELILPRHATVEITELCNLKCVYCYNDAGPLRGKHMPLDDILKVFKTLSDNGVTVIEISGGEPMIHPNIDMILKAAFQYFDWVAILSNGVYLPKKIMPILEEHRNKFGGVQISIDGSCEEVNAKMRQVKNTFSKTLENIIYLKEHDFLVRVVIVLTEENIEDIGNTCELMKQIGVKHFGISISEEWGRGKTIDKKDFYSEKTYRNYFKDKYGEVLKEINEKYRDILFNDKILGNINLSKVKNCGAGWQTIAVTVSGDVEICAPGKIKLGNMLYDSYEDIFGSEIVKKLHRVSFKEVRETDCLQCSDVADCAMCFAKIVAVNRKRIEDGKGLCSIIKKYELEELVQ